MNVDQIVEKYMLLRKKKEAIDAEYKANRKRVTDAMARIETALLKMFEDAGVQSIKTAHGTPYINTRESVTVADRDAYFEFVIENEAWEMLESRASKNAVMEYKEAHGELPPGLNYRAERTINVKS